MSKQSTKETKDNGTTGIEMLAGVIPPVHVNLIVQITPGHDGQESHGLPTATIESLMAQEPKLLKWLASNHNHQVGFIADPVGSLAKAGIKLPLEALATLRRLHEDKAAANVLPPGVKLASLSTSVGKDSKPVPKGQAKESQGSLRHSRAKGRK
jgi:hypothetical protein